MNTSTVLLTCDEATVTIVEALDDVTATLRRRHPRRTIKALLENRACRARLEIDEEQALDRFRATITAVASLGHSWIISDQIAGYLSALADDPTFTSKPGRHLQGEHTDPDPDPHSWTRRRPAGIELLVDLDPWAGVEVIGGPRWWHT